MSIVWLKSQNLRHLKHLRRIKPLRTEEEEVVVETPVAPEKKFLGERNAQKKKEKNVGGSRNTALILIKVRGCIYRSRHSPK
jgi:hypothetical protein